MRYYIADCHFFHEALNREMDHRGFASVEEMNEYMIKRWNEKVRNRDEVVILGDLSMGNAEQTNTLLDRLQGKLFLIVGNHDNRYLRSKTFHKERFGWIYPYAELHDDGRKVVLSHYPIACYNGQYLKKKKGEHIFRDKDKIQDIFIVLKGKVTLYKMNEYGQKRIVYILGEESFLNEVIVDDLPTSINGEVFENSIIFSIDKNKLLHIMSKDFELTKIVLNEMSKKVRRLYRQMKNVTPIKLEKRVAAKLWKLSKDYGKEVPGGTLIDLDISITYLADMFGSPRESVSRAIKTLRDENLIIKENKKIIIPDRERIAAYFKSLI